MAMIEDVLQKIARQIMALNEETLTALLPRYKQRMMSFAPTKEWEEAVVIYFLINGLRIKNSQFNDKIKEFMVTDENGDKCGPHIRPRLRLVTGESGEGDAGCPGCPGCGGPEDEEGGCPGAPGRDARIELVPVLEAEASEEPPSAPEGPHEHDE
ncbi:hypothetical protein LJB99_01755 [Deltaproteobacteria bacterium OttesenSCG-928-K17]|nr:hypothetical protein [Deltaproteobacteria bacterium OttesenSCG-928-K17]